MRLVSNQLGGRLEASSFYFFLSFSLCCPNSSSCGAEASLWGKQRKSQPDPHSFEGDGVVGGTAETGYGFTRPSQIGLVREGSGRK